MKLEKITATLAALLEASAPTESVEIILELASGFDLPEPVNSLSRSEKIALGEAAFLSAMTPVEQAVRAQGGEVTGRVWINHTMRVRVPVKGIAALSDLEMIALLDLPRRLRLEGG